MSDQCDKSGPHGQCNQPSIEGSEQCAKHSNEADRIRGYRLSNPDLRKRFEHHAANEAGLQSVKEEVLLLRSLVCDRIDMAQSQAEKLAAFSIIRPAIVDIVKCVEILTKLEEKTNVVLGKEALSQLGKDIVKIIVEELDGVENHDEIVDAIASRIARVISDARNDE